MGLAAMLRNLSHRQLWAALLLVAALNVAMGIYIVCHVPIMSAQPYCTDEANAPRITIPGELAEPFLHHYHDRVGDLHHRVDGHRIYVTFGTWFESDWLMNMSNKAVHALLMERTGASYWDILHGRLGVPEFDEPGSFHWPPCTGVRKLTIKGGEWAYQGPPLKPGAARGRIVPLPHLTDPLLFEPVRPREPDADGKQGDAGSR